MSCTTQSNHLVKTQVLEPYKHSLMLQHCGRSACLIHHAGLADNTDTFMLSLTSTDCSCLWRSRLDEACLLHADLPVTAASYLLSLACMISFRT